MKLIFQLHNVTFLPVFWLNIKDNPTVDYYCSQKVEYHERKSKK